jgi:hypothetical protein
MDSGNGTNVCPVVKDGWVRYFLKKNIFKWKNEYEIVIKMLMLSSHTHGVYHTCAHTHTHTHKTGLYVRVLFYEHDTSLFFSLFSIILCKPKKS